MTRFRVEAILAGVFALLAIITLIWPQWIESLTGLEPDGGSGETEWWLVAIFGILAAATALLARRDYRLAHR